MDCMNECNDMMIKQAGSGDLQCEGVIIISTVAESLMGRGGAFGQFASDVI